MRNSRIVAIASCILALALGSTSCKKDKDGHTPGELMTIGATIVQANDDGTKTFLAPNGSKVDVRWSAGDKIMLFGAGDTEGEDFTLSAGAGSSSGKFTGHAPSPFSPYYAAYPESASFDGGSTFTFTIPEEISGVADPSASSDNYSFIQKSTIPMVGVSAHGEDLQFYNAMSSIFLALKGTDKVSSIVLTDLSESIPPLSGTLTVKQDDNTHGIDFSQTSISGGSHTLTLTLPNVQLDEDKYSLFCFPVPKGAFAGTKDSGNVSIKVYDDNEVEIANYTESLAGVAVNTAYALVKTITGSTTLTASTTSFGGSKTYLDPNGSGLDVKWSEGDKIKLFGNSGTGGQIFTLQSGAGQTTASFKGMLPENGPTYYAAYPAPESFDGSKTFTFNVLPTQTHGEGTNFAIADYDGPMVGVLTDVENPSITFNNAMVPLYISLKGSGTITDITLTDKNSDAMLTGKLSVTVKSDGTIQSSTMSDGENHMTLSIESGVELYPDSYHSFCFPVPVGAFSGTDNMQIEIFNGDEMIDEFTHSLPDGVNANVAIEVEKTITSAVTLTASLNKPDGSNWSTGDQIKVYGQKQSAGEVFTATAGTDNVTFTGKPATGGSPYYAVYPQNSGTFTYGSGTATIDFGNMPSSTTITPSKLNVSKDGVPYRYVQDVSVPMVGYSADGSTMTFSNAMSPVLLKLKGHAKLKKIVVTDTDGNKLAGNLTVTIGSGGTISTSMDGTTSTSLTLNISDGLIVKEDTYSQFCFLVPKGTQNLKFEIYDQMCLVKTITKNFSGGTALTGTYEVTEDNIKTLILPGEFYVSSSLKVHFSGGNLYAVYDGSGSYMSDYNFYFEKTQWDAVIATETFTDQHIGQFRSLNYSNYNFKNAVNYTTTSISSISSYLFTNNDKTAQYSGFSVEGFKDKFRCLTTGEYQYLYNNNTWGLGTVNGMKGLILFPKGVTAPTGFTDGNFSESANIFEDDTWDEMEFTYGAVFLPLAGYGINRNSNYDNRGIYLASYNNNTSSLPNVLRFAFVSDIKVKTHTGSSFDAAVNSDTHASIRCVVEKGKLPPAP